MVIKSSPFTRAEKMNKWTKPKNLCIPSRTRNKGAKFLTVSAFEEPSSEFVDFGQIQKKTESKIYAIVYRK